MPRLTRRSAIAFAGLAMLQGGAYLLYRQVDSRRANSAPESFAFDALASAPLPTVLAFETADGKTFSPRLGQQPLVVHFWATWCAPCRTELPTLLASFEATALSAPRLLLVSVDENWDTIRHYFAGQVPPQVVRDPLGHVSKALVVGKLPETWLVRQDGVAVARVRGARDWRSTEAREVTASLLGVSPA